MEQISAFSSLESDNNHTGRMELIHSRKQMNMQIRIEKPRAVSVASCTEACEQTVRCLKYIFLILNSEDPIRLFVFVAYLRSFFEFKLLRFVNLKKTDKNRNVTRYLHYLFIMISIIIISTFSKLFTQFSSLSWHSSSFHI